jgi:uncharacterized protein (UPF0261 family)
MTKTNGLDGKLTRLRLLFIVVEATEVTDGKLCFYSTLSLTTSRVHFLSKVGLERLLENASLDLVDLLDINVLPQQY